MSSPERNGLETLSVEQFRNFEHLQLALDPGLNLVTGANASGKTSLLEAIFYLGRVRSFRTAVADQPVRYGQAGFRLVGKIREQAGSVVTVGIERREGRFTVRQGGQPVRRLSDLAGRFPVQVFSSEMPSILNGGPRQRRHVLDWALFHVEHGYRESWQRYSRVLRQRNAALRSGAGRGEVSAWDGELLEAGLRIDLARREYLDRLEPFLATEMSRLLPGRELGVHYQRGWPESSDLVDALHNGLEKDQNYGYTRHGPHRADFRLQIDGHPVAAHCSRGQQKAVLLGFMLAQVGYQQSVVGTAGAFLLDDLTSELDTTHQGRVLQALRDLHAQVFVTAIDPDQLDLARWQPGRSFHVEHGTVHEHEVV